MIFGFNLASRQLRRRVKGRGRRGDFRGGADTTGEVRFTSVWFQRKQKRCIRGQEFVVRGQDAVPSGPSKTFLASAERPEAVSIAQRDHSLSENANIEKVGRFFNLFRTVISFCRLVLSMVCKPCTREKLPPHLYKSGGNRLR